MNPTRARQSGGGLPAGGFTLIELLVVILIIMCLVGALVPTLAGIRIHIMGNHTQTTINMIHGAVRQYWEANNNTYPIGNLVTALTTYSGTVSNDGTIFRTSKGAGSYGVDALKTTSSGTAGGACFADVFNGPIIYATFSGTAPLRSYPRDGSEQTTVREIGGTGATSPTVATMFNASTETNPKLKNRSDLIHGMWVKVNASNNLAVLLGPGNGTSPTDLDYYVRREKDAPSATEDARSYYRRDFILISPGADGAFVDFKDNSRSDDRTNFNN